MNIFNISLDDGEEWRDVVGFEGYYQVSNWGRVKTVSHKSKDGRNVKEQIRKAQGSTYLAIDLWKNGTAFHKSVHRLVAEAFLPNLDNLPEVNHKDCNPKNNRVDNLEWVTSKGNSVHRLAKGNDGYKYRKEVMCLETGEIFRSLTAAGNSVEASTQQVIDSINSHSCCKGKTFVYTNQMPESIDEYVNQAHARYQKFHRRPMMKNAKKVKVIETGEVFDSIAAAARYFSVDTATITGRIRENRTFDNVTLQYVN